MSYDVHNEEQVNRFNRLISALPRAVYLNNFEVPEDANKFVNENAEFRTLEFVTLPLLYGFSIELSKRGTYRLIYDSELNK